MDIRLYNTLSGSAEEFKPLKKGRVGMYHCGPTVYNYAHIGNLRAYVFADTLRRAFERAGYGVLQLINITDVGHLTSDSDTGKDKIEEEALKENRTAAEIAEFYTNAFHKDLLSLNVRTAGTLFPKAADHISEQIELVKTLEGKGYAYKTSDGMYFDTAKFKDYGKLGKIDLAGLAEGARVEINSEKRHPTDFALWKFSQPHEKRQQEWESPWGVGFPGWHIECSAMSMKYLGETFDIHTGGVDHIPVHHNNEIAQSECATGKEFARYWMHSAFVTVQGDKMAKSGGNFLTLPSLSDKGLTPLGYRYWLLTAHYRSPVGFTVEAIQSAQNAYERLLKFVERTEGAGEPIAEYVSRFDERLYDDLDTPQALAIVWKMIRDKDFSDEDKKATLIELDPALGLNLSGAKKKPLRLPKGVRLLLDERAKARESKDYKESDRLRDEIDALGYRVIDTGDGQEIEKK